MYGDSNSSYILCENVDCLAFTVLKIQPGNRRTNIPKDNGASLRFVFPLGRNQKKKRKRFFFTINLII